MPCRSSQVASAGIVLFNVFTIIFPSNYPRITKINIIVLRAFPLLMSDYGTIQSYY